MERVADRGRNAAATAPGRAGSGRFLRFCCVGGVGFGVDGLTLLAFVHVFGVGPIPARLLSAAVAILTTFELNRRWAFRASTPVRYGAALAAYAGVQSLGLACNVSVYTGCYLLLPAPVRGSSPALLLCLVAASAAALLVNYAGASRVVFRAA